jgi:hypothetical protein
MVEATLASTLSNRAAATALLLILLLFPLYAATPIADGDYWWHLLHGREIATLGELPPAGIALHSQRQIPLTASEESAAEQMRGHYWLAQLALYQLHRLTGEAGIVVLRSLLYTTIIAVAAWLMWRRGERWRVVAFALLLGGVLLHYPNERPALLAFLLFALLLLLLEGGRLAETAAKGVYHHLLAGLLLLVWANTHPSVLLGVAVSGCFLIDALVRARSDRSRLPPAVALAAMLPLPLLNPNGIDLLLYAFSVVGADHSTNHEFITPLRAAIEFDQGYPHFWIALLFAATALAFGGRRLPLAHWLLVPSIALLALSGLRHMLFLPALLPLISLWPPRWLTPPLVIAASIPLLLAPSLPDPSPHADKQFPQQLARHISANAGTNDRLFNYYDWGGYLAWHTGMEVFIDGRNQSRQISDLYDRILWQDDHYHWLDRLAINRIAMPGISEFSGQPFPLLQRLIKDRMWRLEFADQAALGLVRVAQPVDDSHAWQKWRAYNQHAEGRRQLAEE